MKAPTLIKATILIAALHLPATAGQPLQIYLDGQFVGTLAEPGAVYNFAAGEIHITTHELVIGCQQTRVYHDRFEVGP